MIRLEGFGSLAEVALHGAEVRRLALGGRDVLWGGDPAWWGRTAPLLFPIVGALREGAYRWEGRSYALPKHGFARDATWTCVERRPEACALELRATEETRAAYPFEFALRLHYALEPGAFRMEAVLENRGGAGMPAAFGFHPAFRWPLDPGQAREAHRIRFDAAEPDALRELEADLLIAARRPTPVRGHDLALGDALFTRDALIWDAPRSRGLRYGVAGGTTLRLDWDLPHLGVWTKPGAPFLCLEPWQGLADAHDADGDLRAKPGMARLAPGETKRWTCVISLAEGSDRL